MLGGITGGLMQGGIWDLPYGPEIAATITAVATFLGAVLGVSHIQYKKGDN